MRTPGRDRATRTMSLDPDERHANQLQDIDGEERSPLLGRRRRQLHEPLHREVQRVAEHDEQREPPQPLEDGRRELRVRGPVAAGGDAERKAGEQQEEAGGQPALEHPDVEPGAGLIARREQGADRVAVEHEHGGQRPRQVDEDDAGTRMDPARLRFRGNVGHTHALLHRRVVRRVEEDRLDLGDDLPVDLRLLRDLLPLGVLAEGGPVLLGRFAARCAIR